MVSITITEINYEIAQHDFELLEDYLKEVDKRSSGSFKNQKGILLKCLNYINKDIQEISMIDIKKYFDEVVDKKKLALDSKETYRSYLKSFFSYIQFRLLDKNIDFRIPIPSKLVYKFTKDEGDFKRQSEMGEDVFNNAELLEILEMAKKTNYRDFILYSILTITGMRVSEALTIKVENINLEERYIETGFVKDARKSNKALLFFFPKKFKPFLEKYIRYLDNKTEWLFKGRKSYYQTNSWFKQAKKYYSLKYTQFHKFRRTLITKRIKDLKCPLLISEMLMNHKSSSVEGEHYFKLSIVEKRELYDQYFPYSNFRYF